ncbi:hypothetical protein HYH03_014507 [Edaphochlamys debaryana]|uniref:Uncharacterized protein n=1 Tax=Edaphochlamys debaryana TaxID=47281 RepID=A0A835XNK6_9CHLO|nr:hypothetical protein HYH03_014507 [Edaphochlamys debaryana]|eukprot:KAG2486824.1 hypothetical protein HYH03_014507 [Edaphochlamys debaryana]
MAEAPLQALAASVSAACASFQASLFNEPHGAEPGAPGLLGGASSQPSASFASVTALTQLLREHQELIARLSVDPGPASAGRGEPEHAELATVAAKRERVLTQGLTALGAVAVSMRAVLDDVEELAPEDNGYQPSVKELLALGHRLRYTTFATTGLYAGEPSPQQLHFDHATLWERALAERHQAMASSAHGGPPGLGGDAAAAAGAGAAVVVVDPRAEAACATLLKNLVDAGWTPDAGFPEPVLAFLSEMPGAVEVLRRLVEERFFGGGAGAGGAGAGGGVEGAEGAGAAGAGAGGVGAGGQQQAQAQQQQQAEAKPANPASRLVNKLLLDEDSDEDDEDDSDESDDD